MKKMYYIFLSITFLNLMRLQAQIGCMDNSKHRNIRDGYDYKKLHFVACSCPCKDYKNLPTKGRCSKCLHFHKPEDIYQF